MSIDSDVSLDAFGFLHKNLDEQIERATTNVISGRATPEEYHRLCGVVQGLNYAKELLKDLAKKLENSDD